MEDIKKMASRMPVVKQYEEAKKSLAEVRDHHNNLYAQLKKKNAELTAAKEIEAPAHVSPSGPTHK